MWINTQKSSQNPRCSLPPPLFLPLVSPSSSLIWTITIVPGLLASVLYLPPNPFFTCSQMDLIGTCQSCPSPAQNLPRAPTLLRGRVAVLPVTPKAAQCDPLPALHQHPLLISPAVPLLALSMTVSYCCSKTAGLRFQAFAPALPFPQVSPTARFFTPLRPWFK